ncbi:MAG: hypothetical protein OXG88_09925 [Gammaproteobacteria bacterium]|nr:hypothetical protein [Gammaproteobacteria bacterium]
MDSRSVKLDEFIAEYRFWGEWEVSYTDGTHLPEDEYVKLGEIIIDAPEETAQNYPILPFLFLPTTDQEVEYRFSELIELLLELSKEQEKANQPEATKKQKDRVNALNRQADTLKEQAKKVIGDQLADSMVRTGLLRPEFWLMEEQITEMRFLEVMRKLSKDRGYLILVTDTSALRRAAISFLHKTLSGVPIWTVVPVFVMTEIQRQAHELKKIWFSSKNKTELKNCKVIGMRPQVSTISRELNHIRQWRPIEMLTTLPEHLGQSNGISRIDRLIIESMKNLKRERGLHQGVYLLTGDKDMASLAALENQGSLHIGVPSPSSEISSIRYNSLNNRLVLTPLHYFLWDLAQVFSTIRLENKKLCRTYELVYYSQASGGFFANDVMEIRGDNKWIRSL